MTCCIQECQLCLSYFWHYLPLLYLTMIIHWFCVRSVSQTLWNIFMILGRNVEQDQTTCRVQEWQLCLSYFWCYLPLCLTVIIHWFRVRSKSKTLWNIFMILGRNVEQTRRRVAYKNDNSAFLTFGVISFCYVWQWSSIDFVSPL